MRLARYVTRISPPAPRDHRPSSGIGFLRRRRVLVELRSSDGTRQRPIHAGSLLSRAVPTPRDLHHSTVRYPVKRYLCRRGCRRWSLGRRDSRSHWERVMKLGPNARTRCRTGPVPSPLRPATAGANRGSHRISDHVIAAWFRCRASPANRRDAATNHFPLVASCDATHTLPEHGLRHPWNEWLRGCF